MNIEHRLRLPVQGGTSSLDAPFRALVAVPAGSIALAFGHVQGHGQRAAASSSADSSGADQAGSLGLVTKLGIPRRISVNDLDQFKRRLPNPKAMMGERMRRVGCAVHGHGLLALPLEALALDSTPLTLPLRLWP